MVKVMKKFYMEVPYTGVLKVVIDAESVDDALNKLYDADRIELEKDQVKDIEWLKTEEYYHDKITDGTRFFGVQNEMVIDEWDDED
ncbi:hypothetical protein AAHH67_15620 [Niallia circulans]